MRIRIVPTASGKKAVQVVSKHWGKVTVHKHIGTYATSKEKTVLFTKAEAFITQTTGQDHLFNLPSFRTADIAVSENRPLFLYRLLSRVYDKLGLSAYPDPLVKDLVIARLYQPASKRETSDILAEMFGREYALKTVYRHVKSAMEKGLKDTFQKALTQAARDTLHDSLKLVFYDVTTLYFESTARTGMKDFGFSKDHKSTEVQIVLGLVVNGQGFPLYFDVFNGRTFEGHTFLTVVKEIQKLLNNPDLVVIADAAMLSQDNIAGLIKKKIGFIVGARIANLSASMIDTISTELKGRDGETQTFTYRDQRLICRYSAKRAAKDRADREKQITRAKNAVTAPATIAGRYRFLKTREQKITLNEELITKAEKLEGIKGYVTNTALSDTTVIERYHDLWRIENSFRITKSDLEARPIFHRLDETIQAHVIIVFAGLAIARYIEIETGMSIKKVLKLAEKVLTHKITNTKTGESAYVETTIENTILQEKLNLLKSLGH